MNPRFSLVIPCYNEAESIPELVSRARFAASAGSGEFVLVNNGSVDATGAVLDRLVGSTDELIRVVHLVENAGYGGGISAGLAVTRADIVGWTHADLQTDPADVVRAMAAFESGTLTFVKGLRFARPWGDRLFTAGMSAFETALMRMPLRDINAQPTLFHRSMLDLWASAPSDFSLDLFAYTTARRRGFVIRRIPVLFAPRRHGQSSWNIDLASKSRFIRRTIDYSLALRVVR